MTTPVDIDAVLRADHDKAAESARYFLRQVDGVDGNNPHAMIPNLARAYLALREELALAQSVAEAADSFFIRYNTKGDNHWVDHKTENTLDKALAVYRKGRDW